MTALVLKITQFCRFLYTSTMEPGRLSDLVLEGSSRAGARVCQGATSGPGKMPNFYEFLWISMNFYGFLWMSMNFYEKQGINRKIGKWLATEPTPVKFVGFYLVRFWRFVHIIVGTSESSWRRASSVSLVLASWTLRRCMHIFAVTFIARSDPSVCFEVVG